MTTTSTSEAKHEEASTSQKRRSGPPANQRLKRVKGRAANANLAHAQLLYNSAIQTKEAISAGRKRGSKINTRPGVMAGRSKEVESSGGGEDRKQASNATEETKSEGEQAQGQERMRVFLFVKPKNGKMKGNNVF